MTARKRPPRPRGNPPESPWRNASEGVRNTVARKLRLEPDENAALVAVAALMGLDLSRAVGALAKAELRRRRGEHEIDGVGVDTGAPVT